MRQPAAASRARAHAMADSAMSRQWPTPIMVLAMCTWMPKSRGVGRAATAAQSRSKSAGSSTGTPKRERLPGMRRRTPHSRSPRPEATSRSSSSTESEKTTRSPSTVRSVEGHHFPGPFSTMSPGSQPASRARRTSRTLMHSASMSALRASMRYSASGLVLRLYA